MYCVAILLSSDAEAQGMGAWCLHGLRLHKPDPWSGFCECDPKEGRQGSFFRVCPDAVCSMQLHSGLAWVDHTVELKK